jgi:hypothetical protein
LDQTSKFKVWLALLQHLNQAKSDRIQAAMIKQKVQDKHWIDKPVVVTPILDKILPDEKKVNYY